MSEPELHRMADDGCPHHSEPVMDALHDFADADWWSIDIEDWYYADEDDAEPVGSCDNCGTDLFPWDDPELCEQCEWYASQD